MRWKKRSLRNCSLYLVLDAEVKNYDQLFDIFKRSVRNGVDIVQLRDKRGPASDILRFSKRAREFSKNRVHFIINDRVDLAVAAKAAGVHLGQGDIPVSWARKIMGPKAVIGVSCQNLRQAKEAVRSGADYIGFGSVFKTKTKPERSPMDLDLLSEVVRKIKIPVFAIGGISLNNLTFLKKCGARRIAVCRAICEASDAGKMTRAFKNILNDFS